MAKRLAWDLRNKTPRSKKTKKRLATKAAMLAKLKTNRRHKRKAANWA